MHILFIEDNRLYAETLIDFFDLHHIKITHASNYEQAILQTYSKIFDAIIIDIGLPDGNGIDLLKAIKDWNNSIPIIMLTSQTKSSFAVECFSIGADDYVRKDCDFDELLARINLIFRRKRNNKKILQLTNEYSFDFETCMLLHNNKSVHLQYKLNKFLHLLCANYEKIVSIEEIQNTLWSPSEDSSMQVIRVYVNRLRSILGESAIINHKNYGYRLNLSNNIFE